MTRNGSFKGSFKRWLYRTGRPNGLARLFNRGWALVGSAGIGRNRVVTLEVPGRRTGRDISFPVVLADYEGDRYLVAMLGKNAGWVRNVRAASGRVVLRHGRREDAVLEEIPVDDRPPILRRYLNCAPGARPHIPVNFDAPLEEFEAIAPQIPVFCVTNPER